MINKFNKMARAILSQMAMEDLLVLYELTEYMPADRSTAIIRLWIMDELQDRCPPAFDNWMDSGDRSPSRFFVSLIGISNDLVNILCNKESLS